ncbi:hypothetical protein [Chloroflexus sp.]|uniref:hypothetical protein n=1 Tax=Chloroflexus sp. TaxID=1904827 RepID=UPI002ACD8DDF|nr:hypothetical protein [Chloroflexus sp.]
MMIVQIGANTAPPYRAVILWMLAFLIGPWSALSCIIHCHYLPHTDAAGVEFFLCDAPHTAAQHDLPPPPVRYDLWPLGLMIVIGGLVVIQRFVASRPVMCSSVVLTPDPPPPRRMHFQPAS